MSTWMVVEDEPDIYDVLVAMFQIWGIEGIAFVDGADAVQWVEGVDAGRVPGELPELAILDIRLPEVSGPEVAARIRKSPKLGNIGIVLITAYRLSPEQEKNAMTISQADLLLYKPLPNMPELRQQLDDVIKSRREKLAPEVSSAPAEPVQKQIQPVPAPTSPAASGLASPTPEETRKVGTESTQV